MSYRVLLAMQEPIKKGDRFLCSHNGRDGELLEDMAYANYDPWWAITGIRMRLPDRFQKKDEVEEKIKEIAFDHGLSIASDLRELVALVKKQCQEHPELLEKK